MTPRFHRPWESYTPPDQKEHQSKYNISRSKDKEKAFHHPRKTNKQTKKKINFLQYLDLSKGDQKTLFKLRVQTK